MKKVLTPVFSFLLFFSQAQLFNASGGPILNNGGQETVFTLNVSGLTQDLDSLYGLEEICVHITHPAVEELHVYLTSPAEITVDLSSVLSLSGGDLLCCFRNDAATSITTGTAPYNGAFKAAGNLGRFNANKTGNGDWHLYVKDFIPGANAGTLVNWSLKFSAAPAQPVFVTSSNLPLVFINTQQPLGDADVSVDLGIVDNGPARNHFTDPWNGYNGKALVHKRGSSSKMFEKKNLKIELIDATGAQVDASLLGMPAESDWVLCPGYSDKTLMRNALTQYIFTQMGHYSPRYRFVELFINGEYFGVYTLIEKIKRGSSRVDIKKMAATDNNWPYVSGGYIIQVNRSDDPGWYSSYPGVSNSNAKFYYQFDHPNALDVTTQQSNYIKSFLDTFETVMQSANYTDPYTGYRTYANEDSFIDFFILNELSKNVDGYRLSTYLYKDCVTRDKKLHIGPAWDYDLAWHNCKFGNTNSALYWQYQQANDDYPIPTWWGRFTQDAAFIDKLYCRYHTLRLNTLSDATLHAFIDNTAFLLDEAQQRNFRQFPILGAYIYPNPQVQAGASYASEVSDLKQWITDRGTWMDANVPGFCNNVQVASVAGNETNLDAFPNPFTDTFQIDLSGYEGARVNLELKDMLGQIVLTGQQEVKQVCEVKAAGLKPGTYILKVDCGGKCSMKKLVKL